MWPPDACALPRCFSALLCLHAFSLCSSLPVSPQPFTLVLLPHSSFASRSRTTESLVSMAHILIGDGKDPSGPVFPSTNEPRVMTDKQVHHLEGMASHLTHQAMQLERAKPNRCSTRMQDFVITTFYEWQFAQTPSRWKLMRQCYSTKPDQEPPRDPHLNVTPAELPRWDPWHPLYDPEAPFDSFERSETQKRKVAKARAQAGIIAKWATEGSTLWKHPDQVALDTLRQAKERQDNM